MSLPSVKKGSSVGRVRMAFTHPQTTLVNYYVGGSGVGAVSTSNRRALRSRASWRPTQDGKGSTRCSGFCQPNRFANNVEFMRQGGRGAVNDKTVPSQHDVRGNLLGEGPNPFEEDTIPIEKFKSLCGLKESDDPAVFLNNKWRTSKCGSQLRAVLNKGGQLTIANNNGATMECGALSSGSWVCREP